MFWSFFLGGWGGRGDFSREKCFELIIEQVYVFVALWNRGCVRCHAIDPELSLAAALDCKFIFSHYFAAYCFSALFPSIKRFFKTSISHLSSDDQFVGESTLLTKTGDVLPSYGLPYLTILSLFAIISRISCAGLVITASFLMDWFSYLLCLPGTYSSTYPRYLCSPQT